MKIIFHDTTAQAQRTQPGCGNLCGTPQDPRYLSSTHPWAGPSHHDSSVHYGFPNEHQDKEEPSFPPASVLQNSNVFFSVPLANAGDPRGWKELKNLRAGTENKDQNKHLTRQGLNAWRAVQQEQPWQQIKQRHKAQFNHRFLRFIYYDCLYSASRILIIRFMVFFPVILISTWFQLVRY